jgi:hypothetical protein
MIYITFHIGIYQNITKLRLVYIALLNWSSHYATAQR